MLQESEPRITQNGFDPSMNRHRPASVKTQDISHLLASIFKDLYTTEVIGKDTVANLTKSRRGSNNYHDKYVEELQQVHLEYSRRMRDADMLENHIIQARVQATVTEDHAHVKVVSEVGEAYHQLGLPPVRSTFMWCVDNRLLKSNNLICPEDYITEQAPLVKAPRVKSTPGFSQPTLSYNKHICTVPQDDGYTAIPPLERMAQSMLEGSEETLTLASSQSSTMRSTPTEKFCQVRKPSWMEEPSAKSRAEERAALQKLTDRHNFLRNPRFLPPNAHRGGKSLILPGKRMESVAQGKKALMEESEAPVPVFIASPPIVFFTDYRVGQVYETAVELKNLTATSRHVRVIPPTTPHFSIGLGRFPGEGGIVAPGMSCQYTVRFAPDTLADYEDFLVVETQALCPLLVPVEARRPPPVLSLPRVLDCGYCLVGGVKFVEFLCRNEGLSTGTFCVVPKRQWPAPSLRSVVAASYAEQPPFAVSPSLFQLLPGQATVMEVVFFPTAAECCSQDFTIACDNCQVKDVSIQGEGQLITLELMSVTGDVDRPTLGELCDLTAEHFIRFGSANPCSVLQKTMVIRNNAHLELPFHWQIMKPNLQPILPGEAPDPSRIEHRVATDDAFHISPASGLLAPLQEHKFLLTFFPQELMDYHSVCHLVMRDIPDRPKEYNEEGAPQPLEKVLKVNDVIVMEIEVKGSTEPYQILLEPYAIYVPGEIFIHTTIRKRFKMWNHSKSAIRFEWERLSDCHIIVVEPPTGEIEMNECFDLELVLTGGRPGHFVSTLQCHVQHRSRPVGLAIEITFKGPHLKASVPSLDLGLLRLGEQCCSTLQITNTSQLEACWSLHEVTDQPGIQGQIVVEPCKGLLPPLASCSVEVLFRALLCQHFESILELAVENGTGCNLSIQANVQSPQVCLLSCTLVLSKLYVGIPERDTVTLFNQTLLPAHFSWGKLQGRQASLCSASFSPSTGTLGPNAKLEVTVSFTADTDEELTDVAVTCEVKGMNSPLVLGFFSKAKHLCITYSLLSDCPSMDDDEDTLPLSLDFGREVVLGRAVTRQLVMTNHTAIPAPYTIEAEYFNGCPSQSAKHSQHRVSRVRRPLHSVQAKKVEEKAYEDFVSGLLAHGKGAAFFVQPDTGTLGPFETQTINITAFTNVWGDYQDQLICKVGYLEPTFIPMQMSVRGCPLYFQMIGPQPDSQNQGPIIRFGTHVSGGDTVSRTLRLNNTSLYDIRMDWETFNQDPADRKLVDLVVAYGGAFPLKDADGNEVVGGRPDSSESFLPTWDQSHTPSTEGTTSSLRTKSQAEELAEDEEEKGAHVSLAPVRKLFSVFLRPHEANASDYPYCITPQQIVVPAGGSSIIHVSFTPLTLSGPTSDPRCVGFALGFMSLDSKVASWIPGKVERAQGYELQPLRLDLQASVKPAVLTVQMAENEEVLEFCAVASDLIQGEPHKEMAVQNESVLTRTLQLKNSTEMPLSFKLSTQPPFSVLQPQARGGTASSLSHSRPAESPPLLLQPRHNMQVKLAFHSSLSLLAYQNQPCEELPPSVTLTHSDAGEKRLRFQQSLAVQYSNNSVQTVPLCAYLALPMMHMSCDSMDFGTCYVGQTLVKEVHLYNRGGSSSYWTAAIEAGEESGVFRVMSDCGVLKPLEYPVSSCRQPLQISFTASDQEEFRTTVTVRGVLGEPTLTLQVQGRGSFDEKFESPLADV